MSGGECDFCSSPDVQWAYPCRDFQVDAPIPGVPDQGSSGSWAACPVCHVLIERADRAKLARRSAKRLQRKYNISLKVAIATIRQMQDGFWSHREGPPVPALRGQRDDPAADRVPVEHRGGPDFALAAQALGIAQGRVWAILVNANEHTQRLYYTPTGSELVWRQDTTVGDSITPLGEPTPLDGDWDAVRERAYAGAA